ncbi:SDR family NAD(P)-dependent oxidoreductase [Dyella sedimenti]|uniref:SDR family NAD(P)-dependent oxidoreductase n=1 Tax=Dyella sedimenti TaxID=2919947 RepID=UPI001FAA59DC|nr:SDR family NAD(P)-dependent oxidoreductase [Dyella sedimenti]
MPTPSTALIIGASRGLGLALAAEYLKRGWHVVATVRGNRPTPLHDLAATAGGRLEIARVDIDIAHDVAALRRQLNGRRFDLLFVNAGIALQPELPIGKVGTEDFIRMMVTNALSPMRVIESFESLVPPDGAIAAMSSELGSVGDNVDGGWEAYRASKAALNTLMRSFAARHAGDPRTLLLIAPGWVRTDMGGPDALLSIEESIPRVVDTVSAQAGKAGLRYLDYRGQVVPW